MGQVLAEYRAHVGIHYRGAEPVVLFDLGQNIVGQGSVQARGLLPYLPEHHFLVGRIHIGKEKAHGQGLHPLLQQLVNHRVQGLFVQRGLDASVEQDSLRDAQPEISGDQGLHRLHSQIVAVLLHPFPHLQQVSEPFRCDQAHSGPLPLHQRVGGHGSAVDDEGCIGQKGIGTDAEVFSHLFQSRHHPFRGVLRSGGRLEEPGRLPISGHYEVGEGPPNIYTDLEHWSIFVSLLMFRVIITLPSDYFNRSIQKRQGIPLGPSGILRSLNDFGRMGGKHG